MNKLYWIALALSIAAIAVSLATYFTTQAGTAVYPYTQVIESGGSGGGGQGRCYYSDSSGSSHMLPYYTYSECLGVTGSYKWCTSSGCSNT